MSVPVCTLPDTAQTADFMTRPPSSGRPGTRLRTPTSRLVHTSPCTATDSTPSGVTCGSTRPTRPTTIEVTGPDDRDEELLTGRPGLALDRGHAAQEVQGDGAHRVAVVARHEGVRRLVQQHREIEQDGEGEPADVLPAADAGLSLLDRLGHDDRQQRGDEEPGRRDVDLGAGDAAQTQGAGRPRVTADVLGTRFGSSHTWRLLQSPRMIRGAPAALSAPSPRVAAWSTAPDTASRCTGGLPR